VLRNQIEGGVEDTGRSGRALDGAEPNGGPCRDHSKRLDDSIAVLLPIGYCADQ
jgi:hypothetical protein